MQGESSGPCLTVLGIGINIDMGTISENKINQPWIDINNACDIDCDRNKLVATLIKNLSTSFAEFENEGFASFRSQWLALHAYADKKVKVIQGEKEHFGKISNIDNNGALYLRDENGKEKQFFSGEVSLRLPE
jgi:BirA family biotin operon repressor/biotin-[acetyl-CoA-carboxylase] ligase